MDKDEFDSVRNQDTTSYHFSRLSFFYALIDCGN